MLGIKMLENWLTMRFEIVLQRWQNYTNIAPFIEGVNRYPLAVIRGSVKSVEI
jgi:hypothetical protein